MTGIYTGIATALALLTFIGIVWWAFSSGRKKDNEEAASLPFLVEDEIEQVDEDLNSNPDSNRNMDKKQEGSHE